MNSGVIVSFLNKQNTLLCKSLILMIMSYQLGYKFKSTEITLCFLNYPLICSIILSQISLALSNSYLSRKLSISKTSFSYFINIKVSFISLKTLLESISNSSIWRLNSNNLFKSCSLLRIFLGTFLSFSDKLELNLLVFDLSFPCVLS